MKKLENDSQDFYDFIEEEVLSVIEVWVIEEDDQEIFTKAYEEGWQDYEEIAKALDTASKVVICNGSKIEYESDEISYGDEIFEGYSFENFCEEFSHCEDVPLQLSEKKYSLIVDEEKRYALNYIKDIDIKRKNFFYTQKVYLQNILLHKCDLMIPYMLEGLLFKSLVINIKHADVYPNISRDTLGEEKMLIDLSYAVGKAIHLWILDNVTLDTKKRKLIKKFIDKFYALDNDFLKK